MEVNRVERNAVAMVDGKPADLLDAGGRLIITPHPLMSEGRVNVVCDLRLGESLGVFLDRHIPDLNRRPYAVSIGGWMVPPEMWDRTWPRHGQIIEVRGVLQKSVLAIAAMAVLTYFTFGAGALASGMIGINGAAMLGATGTALAVGALNVGLFVAGSMLINKVLMPKASTPGVVDAGQTYALSGGRNQARQFQPVGLLLGQVRIVPDMGSLSYTWFEGEDLYLSTILDLGLNVSRLDGEIFNGDTALSSYEGIEIYRSGFADIENEVIPLYSNPDATNGGALTNGGDWVVRTSSADTCVLQVDIEGTLFDMSGSGKVGPNTVTLYVEYAPTGSGQWVSGDATTITNASTKPVRRTLSIAVARGQYDIRVRAGLPSFNDGEGKDQCDFSWTQLKSFQADDADYSGRARIGIKAKATGQLNGSLDELRVDAFAKSMPVWDGSTWQTATTRENGLSNPGAQILMLARGIFVGDRLVAGLGLDDEEIDIEALKGFMLHCAAHDYTFDVFQTDAIRRREFLDTIALCGMGQITDAGGRLSVVWAAENQPVEGVVNMATVRAGTFSVDYNLVATSDGIAYTFFDRSTWTWRTLRVAAPGVTTIQSPTTVRGIGVTTESHAAVMARFHLAQSIYQNRDVSYATDLECLTYRRLNVVAVTHDLTKWGAGGRLTGASQAGGAVSLFLDAPVPAGATPYIGLRVPGEKGYRVFELEAIAQETRQVTLKTAWPNGVAFPGVAAGNPVHDTIWIFDFKATPGLRARVVSLAARENMGGATVAIVPEPLEYWPYVLEGVYEPPPNPSLQPAVQLPVASNLRVTEQQVVQGDTVFTELTVSFDVTGQMESAEIWAAPEGQEPVMRASTRTRQATWRVDQAGNWLIQVRPFGSTRPGPVASLLYVTQTVDLPPWNYNEFSVQEVTGGIRRYVFAYTTDDPPIDLAGAEIRYIAGAHTAPAWDAMVALGGDAGIHTAQFESVLPPAGAWTFALRARNRGGQLSTGLLLFQAVLGDSFEQVQTKDPTPPPDVVGLTATAGITGVLVDFTAPTYTQGHGHDRTVIYAAEVIAGAPPPSFADARVRVEPYGPPAAMASDPATTWDIWAKHRTVDGVLSANAAGPVRVTTAQNPAKLVEALEGALSQRELTPEFQGEIAQQQGRTDTLEVEVRGARRREDDEGILADVINQWTSRAAIREVRQVVAGIDGTLQATWAVEMELDANGNKLAGGFSLIGSSGEEGSRLDFGILANRFYIGSPIGDGIEPVTPFMVVTVPEEINGVEVPPGVYMRSAVIMNGSITNAQIGNAQIDSAKVLSLDAALLTAGEGIIGGRLRSANYVANESGWIVHPDGTAEFAGVVVRGTVYATAGTVGGWTIGSTEIRSSNYVAGAQGVRLGSGGQVEMRSADSQRVLDLQAAGSAPVLKVPGLEARADGSATFGGALQAASGTFSGDLQAAGGTFKGTLTAEAVNAVQEVNIAGNAVSVTTAGLAGDVGAEQWTSGNDVMYQNAVQIYVEPSAHSKTIFWSAYARGKGGGTTRRCRIRIQFLVDGAVVDEREFLNADGYYFVDSTGETPVPGWMYPIEHNSVNGQHLDTAHTGRTYALRAAIGGDFSEGYVRVLRSQITAITLKK